ncbi:MAG: DUF4034 domain-containing protein [Prochloron sp. SP5CPC1]|nr:DUF4034 domain-containing protein [Candidatus Paraprochloron terpiosi SP5CPC1]
MYNKSLIILLSIVASTGLQCCSLSDFTSGPPSSLVAKAQFQPGVRGKVPFEEQSRILVENLSKGKFSEIEQTLIEGIENYYITRGGSYYSHAVLAYSFDTYSDYLDDNWLNALNIWVQESPSSSLAYTARAYFHYFYGWKFRGERYTSKTPPEALEAYQNQISLSLRDTEKALELDPTNPLALQNMLTIGRNYSISRDVFEDYFQRVNEQVPFFLHAYQEKSIYLDPRWHGSEQEVFAFVRKAVKTSPRELFPSS